MNIETVRLSFLIIFIVCQVIFDIWSYVYLKYIYEDFKEFERGLIDSLERISDEG